MTAYTDSAAEDRIRTAFQEMMPVILGVRDLGNLTETVDDPADFLAYELDVGFMAGGDRRRRRPAMVAALASCVVLVVGGIVLFSRRVAEVDETPAATTPSERERLAAPAGPCHCERTRPGHPEQLELRSTEPGWASAGNQCLAELSSSGSSDRCRGPHDRRADGVQAGRRRKSRTYFAQPNCAALNVTTPATIPPWDTSVTDLLAGLTMNSGEMTVKLPAGWKELATGPQLENFNTAFTHTIGTSAREMRLFQSRNASVAQFLSETYRGTAAPITFGRSPAWVVHSNDSLAMELPDLVDRDHSGNARRPSDQRC